MKKIMIAMSLMFSVIMAGDIVAGVELGKEVPKSFKKVSNADTLLSHLFRSKKSNFFDLIEVETDQNKTARAVSLVKKYKLSGGINLGKSIKKVQKDFKRILDKLESKYGKFDKSELSIMNGKKASSMYLLMSDIQETAINKTPKSDNIGKIMIFFKSQGSKKGDINQNKTVNIGVVYMDKFISEKLKKEKASELDEL